MEKLNLGSGLDKLKGYVNLDYNKSYKPDILWDITKLPLPFKNNKFDEVLACHVTEHIDNPLRLMEELWRITKSGGVIRIYNPHWSNYLAFKDITHKWYPTGYSYDQFETHPNYYSNFAKFKIKRVIYSIGSHQKRHKIIKKLFIKFINIFININRDFTEYILCRYIPINETYYELEVIK